MALQKRRVDIVFEHGVRQHTDPKLLPNGWFKSANNRFLDKEGRWVRRNGITALVTKDATTGNDITEEFRRLPTREDEQIAITDTYLYTRVRSLDKFANRGLVPQCSDMRKRDIKRYADKPARHAAIACGNNYRLVAWIKAENTGNATETGELWAALYDELTGAKVLEERLVTSKAAYPTVVNIGTAFYVLYIAIPGTGTNTLRARILSTAGPTIASFDATTYINVDVYNASCVPTHRPYDAEAQSGSLYIWHTVSGGATVAIEQFDTSLAQIAFQTSARPATNVGMCATSNRLWLIASDAANGTYYYRCDLAVTTLSGPSAVDGSVNAQVLTIIESAADSTKAIAYYADVVTPAAPTPSTDYLRTFQARLTSAGSTTLFGDKLYHFWPASKPFQAANGRLYCIFAMPSKEYNGLYCMMDMRDDILVTAAASTRPEPEAMFGYGQASVFENLFYQHPKEVALVSNTHVAALGQDLSLESWADADGTPTTSWLYSLGGIVTYEWDFTNEKRRAPVDAQNTLEIGGLAMPVQYDGTMCVETGFAYAPDRDFCKIIDSASAGSLTAATGVYQWCFVFEHYDDLGKRHLSQPSIPIQHTMGAAKTSVDIRIQTLTATLRRRYNVGSDCRILVYRTPESGSIFYLVDNVNVSLPINDMTTHSVTFNEGLSDAALVSNETLYTVGGIQRNALPGSSSCMINHKSRLFSATGNTVRYSKLLRAGVAPEFPPTSSFNVGEGEAVTALGSLDDSLVVFTENRIHVLQYDGLGPDDFGNPPFPETYLLSSECGCIDSRIVATFRGGLFFLSRRTLELLPRGGGPPMPIGLALEDDLAAYPIWKDVRVVPDAGQVRFLCTNEDGDLGIIPIYDYDNETWFTWSSIVGYQASGLWDNEYVLSESLSAGIAKEDSTTYQDYGAGFVTSTLETGDIRIAGLSGEEHVWETHILGEYLNTSVLNLYASYDGGKTYIGPEKYEFVARTFTAGQEIAIMLPNSQQRTTSLRLKLVDAMYTTPAYGIAEPIPHPDSAGPVWNGISLLVGVEPGLRAVPVASRGA